MENNVIVIEVAQSNSKSLPVIDNIPVPGHGNKMICQKKKNTIHCNLTLSPYEKGSPKV